MKRNLQLTGGLIYSQRLLLAMVERGAQRREAYEAVQGHAMESWQGRGDFQDLVSRDARITKYLSPLEIAACFDPSYYLRHLAQIYDRVFGDSSAGGVRSRKPVSQGKRRSARKPRRRTKR